MADAHDLNERLARRREQDARTQDRRPRPRPVGAGIEYASACTKCTECGKPFEYEQVSQGGRPIGSAPLRCTDCVVGAETGGVDPNRIAWERRQESMPEILEDLGFARIHFRCTLTPVDEGRGEGYNVRTGKAAALSAARAFVDDFRAAGRFGVVRGLGLVGATGLGKTHLIAGVVREILSDPTISPSQVIYDHANDLITMVQDTYGTGATMAAIEARVRCRLWILDEFGGEKGSVDALRILHGIINRREGAPTLIAGNHDLAEIGEKWPGDANWDRILSRLGAMNFRWGKVTGTDQRTITPTGDAAA